MNYLKEKLKERNITQKELAVRVEKSTQTINNLINHKVLFKKIDADYLYDIANVLNVSVDELFKKLKEEFE